jgi:transposase
MKACNGRYAAAQIAKEVGVSRRQFFNWVNLFKKRGVDGLRPRPHGGGAPPRVRGGVLKGFRAGLKTGRWKRAKEIQQWLLSEHQVKLSLKGVYYWRRKLSGP